MNRWLYEHNHDNTARYILGEPGLNMLACFGINPSTATPEKLDPTLTQVKQRAKKHGYDGWVMFNVYPQRATDPNKLHKTLDAELHEENMRVITEFFSKYNCDIWAAWGTVITKRLFLPGCLKDITLVAGNPSRWIRIGPVSKSGHPHHPLYLKHSYCPEAFDIRNYLLTLG